MHRRHNLLQSMNELTLSRK